MPERVLPLLAVALAAIGCSVLVNTDFSGGTEPGPANKGGQGGDTVVETGGSLPGFGGTVGEGGVNDGGSANSAEGGVGNENGQGAAGGLGGTGMSGGGGDAGEAEGGSGADEGVGGSSGGPAGSSGSDATGGAGMGGTAGAAMGGTAGAAMGGAGMGGGAGTLAGMSGAGGMTCDADLTSDHDHCGACTTACAATSDCIDSKCVSSPCDQLCPTTSMWTGPVDNSNGTQIQKFNSTADICVEVKSYDPPPPFIPTFNCWNAQTRIFEVNGARMQCDVGNKPLTVSTRKGGYCVHASAGTADYAGFVMPNNGLQQ